MEEDLRKQFQLLAVDISLLKVIILKICFFFIIYFLFFFKKCVSNAENEEKQLQQITKQHWQVSLL